MATIPPPDGLNDSDYEAIEAAVTETVRGRWFLSEFARRNRAGEMRQLLDAILRLETNVMAAQQPALPSADPSIRLLIQRIKEVSGQLEGLAGDMRQAGIDERFPDAVVQQARAVSGMMRSGPAPATPPLPAPAPALERAPDAPRAPPRMPRANLPLSLAPQASRPSATPEDPRRAALSGFDSLPLAEKLALFS